MAKRIKPTSYFFPIGYIIEVDNKDFDPNSFYSNGKWERIKGKVIVGVDENDSDFNVTGKIGGSKFLQAHYHDIRYGSSIGSGVTISCSDVGLSVLNIPNFAWQKNYENEKGSGSSLCTNIEGTGNAGNLQPYYTAYVWKLVSYM